MPKITINREKCKGCLLCISACPQGLIAIDRDLNLRGVKPVKFSEKSATAKGACKGCALCALVCPDCCIEVYK